MTPEQREIYDRLPPESQAYMRAAMAAQARALAATNTTEPGRIVTSDDELQGFSPLDFARRLYVGEPVCWTGVLSALNENVEAFVGGEADDGLLALLAAKFDEHDLDDGARLGSLARTIFSQLAQYGHLMYLLGRETERLGAGE